MKFAPVPGTDLQNAALGVGDRFPAALTETDPLLEPDPHRMEEGEDGMTLRHERSSVVHPLDVGPIRVVRLHAGRAHHFVVLVVDDVAVPDVAVPAVGIERV